MFIPCPPFILLVFSDPSDTHQRKYRSEGYTHDHGRSTAWTPKTTEWSGHPVRSRWPWFVGIL